MAQDDLKRGAVAVGEPREDQSHHPEKEMAMDGHTLRKPATNITACSLSGTLKGSGGEADRRKSWRRTIHQQYEDLGMSWDKVKGTAKTWVRWKAAKEA